MNPLSCFAPRNELLIHHQQQATAPFLPAGRPKTPSSVNVGELKQEGSQTPDNRVDKKVFQQQKLQF